MEERSRDPLLAEGGLTMLCYVKFPRNFPRWLLRGRLEIPFRAHIDKGHGSTNSDRSDESLWTVQIFSNSANKAESSPQHLGSDGITSLGGTKGAAETMVEAAAKVTAHTADNEVVVTTLVTTWGGT